MNRSRAPLRVIAREWLRIGLTGFGGPPAHVTLLRDLVVRREGWMDARAFEDGDDFRVEVHLVYVPESCMLADGTS